jgi:3-oxoacyl-[acyl-carrier protein] reductase
MDLGLRGKRALVVGGSYGIGGAISLMLAQEGALVYVMARSAGALDALQSNSEGLPGTLIPVQGDALVAADVDRIVSDVAGSGGLDMAILAVGSGKKGYLHELSDAEWAASYDLNLVTAVRLARASTPYLQQTKGSLTFLGAASGKQPTLGQSASNAAKAALISLTRSLAEELAPAIRVNSVCPGRILTPRRKARVEREAPAEGMTPEQVHAKHAQQTALKRLGSSEEVAAAAVFLASPIASYITGQSLTVDGGQVKGIL